MCSGYLSFVVSILCIGVVTAIIGDVASHFGCTLGIKDSVTAICFVALGTSIPGKWIALNLFDSFTNDLPKKNHWKADFITQKKNAKLINCAFTRSPFIFPKFRFRNCWRKVKEIARNADFEKLTFLIDLEISYYNSSSYLSICPTASPTPSKSQVLR